VLRTNLTQAFDQARDERGAALAWFAIWLPVLIIFVVLVVDVANWFEHKRHLQMQADAAALAGAGKFKLPLSICSDTAVKSEARTYMGDHLDGAESLWETTANYNDQIGKTPASRVHGLINFQPTDPARFWRSDTDDDGGSPCTAKFIEVKLTEKDLPWFFGLPPSVVPWIDARARVSLQQLGTATGLLPIGVPETDPDAVAATFVNECTGTAIASSTGAPAGGWRSRSREHAGSSYRVRITFRGPATPTQSWKKCGRSSPARGSQRSLTVSSRP